MDQTTSELDPRKVRIGLAIVSLILVASIVCIGIADGAVAKAIFFAIAAMTMMRAALLARWLRRQRREGTLAR